MHGQYIRNTDRQLISEEDTFLWISKRDLKAETESEMVAVQDQELQTKYFFPVALQPYRALADRAAAAGQRS
jgi:hypothetical protein